MNYNDAVSNDLWLLSYLRKTPCPSPTHINDFVHEILLREALDGLEILSEPEYQEHTC